jgi:hypothetical protein
MYQSGMIIDRMANDKQMANQLDHAVSSVRDLMREDVNRIGDGVQRLTYYLSCFFDNYADVCAKQKIEDVRFLEGMYQLFRDRKIIYSMVKIYVDHLLKNKTPADLEYIKRRLLKADVNIIASSLTVNSFSLGVTAAICLSFSLSSYFVEFVKKGSRMSIVGLGLYGYVQKAAECAERLRLRDPLFYQALFLQKLEMMFFLIEPQFTKAQAFAVQKWSNDEIANALIRLVKLA